MEFSILVPIYNVENYILECLKSIDSQTHKNFEVILVNDGSTDQSKEICEKFISTRPNFKIINKSNEGLLSARRVGLEHAKGDYCIFCDSDDYLETNALEELHNVIKNQNKPDLIIYQSYEVKNGKKSFFLSPNNIKEGWIENKTIVYSHFFMDYSLNPLWIKAVKRCVVDVSKDYSNLYDVSYGEDLVQSVPLILNSDKIYYLNMPLYNYRIGSGMMKRFNKNYYRSYKKAITYVSSMLKNEDIDSFEEKKAFYILKLTANYVLQFKYSKNIDIQELNILNKDKDFISSIKIIKNSYFDRFSTKEKFILQNLYKGKMYKLKYFLILSKYFNSLKRS